MYFQQDCLNYYIKQNYIIQFHFLTWLDYIKIYLGQNNFILQPFKKNAKMLNKLKYSLSKIHFTLAKFEKIDIFRKISLLKTRGSNEPVSLILNIKCLHVYDLLNFPVNASLLHSLTRRINLICINLNLLLLNIIFAKFSSIWLNTRLRCGKVDGEGR